VINFSVAMRDDPCIVIILITSPYTPLRASFSYIYSSMLSDDTLVVAFECVVTFVGRCSGVVW